MQDVLVCGLDEVGRGALAGPLVAVAALFTFDGSATKSPIPGVVDSKKFSTEAKREETWRAILTSPKLVDFAVGECTVEEINERGIDWCNSTVFSQAVACLKYAPTMIYVDGNNPIVGWPIEKQIVEPQADGRYWPVSAASIIAKVVRDRLMRELHMRYPGYDWASNKGYGAPAHQAGLRQFGACEHHRTLFVRRILEGIEGGGSSSSARPHL